MKPRLFKRPGAWLCTGGGVLGHGIKPLDAYRDWLNAVMRELNRTSPYAQVTSWPPLD